MRERHGSAQRIIVATHARAGSKRGAMTGGYHQNAGTTMRDALHECCNAQVSKRGAMTGGYHQGKILRLQAIRALKGVDAQVTLVKRVVS